MNQKLFIKDHQLDLKVDVLYTPWHFVVFYGVFFLALFGLPLAAHAETPWPQVALPKDIRLHDVGAPITVNGLPMRMTSFSAKTSKAETAKWFRSSLGQPLVENLVGDKLVLGKAIGQYLLSVQMQSIETGTRVLIAVSDQKTGYENRPAVKANIDRLLARLPAGSQLVSHTSSIDAGKQSSYVVVSNTYSEEVNRDRIVSNMRDDGLQLEREATVDEQNFSRGSGIRPNGKTLFFKGLKTEAIAVISRNQESTSVVFNTITVMETLK